MSFKKQVIFLSLLWGGLFYFPLLMVSFSQKTPLLESLQHAQGVAHRINKKSPHLVLISKDDTRKFNFPAVYNSLTYPSAPEYANNSDVEEKLRNCRKITVFYDNNIFYGFNYSRVWKINCSSKEIVSFETVSSTWLVERPKGIIFFFLLATAGYGFIFFCLNKGRKTV